MFLPSIVHQVSLHPNLLVPFKKNVGSELSNYIDAGAGILEVFWKPLLVAGDTV